MNTQNTQEIEVWKVELQLKREEIVEVNYSIYESDKALRTDNNITQQINFSTLLQHVRDTQMNFQYIYSPDELTELDADIFTRENLYVVVKDYLTENLK